MSLQDLPYDLINYTLKKVRLNPLLALRQTSVDCRNIATIALAKKKLQFTCPPGISNASKSLCYCSQRTNWLDVPFVTTANKLEIFCYSDFLMIKDVLQGITHITLKNAYYMTDVRYFGNLHTLDINNCNHLTDVSALGNLHTLKLCNCQRLTDVSALENLHTLVLICALRLTDVSALGKLHTLKLCDCQRLTDVSVLGNIHTLNLSRCDALTDVSALGNVHTLNLSECN